MNINDNIEYNIVLNNMDKIRITNDVTDRFTILVLANLYNNNSLFGNNVANENINYYL